MTDPTRAALAQALDALRYHRDQTRPIDRTDAAIAAAEAALAAPQEPVAECADNDSPWLVCKPCAAAGRCAKDAAPARAEPTDEQINTLIDRTWGHADIAPQSVRAFARAVLALRNGGAA